MAVLGGTCEIFRHIDATPFFARPQAGHVMVARPVHLNPYEFVAVSALRAKQLLAGCTPRLEGDHSPATMAQMEVAAGRITRADTTGPTQLPQCGWQL